MATITTRSGKGEALTHTELDANFTNLNTEVTAAMPKAGGTFTGGIDVTGDTSTDTLTLGLWTVKVDTNELVFVYNGTEVFKLGTNGAVTSADNITAFGTI